MTIRAVDERRLYRWVADHPGVVDTILAITIGVLGVLPYVAAAMYKILVDDDLTVVPAALVSVALVLPIPWRRSNPVAAATAMLVPCVVQAAFDIEIVAAQVAVLLVIQALAGYAPRWAARCGLALALAGIGLLSSRWLVHDGSIVVDDRTSVVIAISVLLLGWSLVGAAWMMGDLTRSRLAERRALADRAERLERERAQAAELAAAEERARIARELHDVVAHSLSIIVRQADGARYAIGAGEGPAAGALEAIAETARGSLGEMRRLLGVLHADEAAPPTAPSPTVRDLDELVAHVRASGVDAHLTRQGTAPADLGAGAELVLYRVVQESLTNVLKHAGAGTRAEVALRFSPDTIDVTVHDTGPGLGAGLGGDGLGRGLTGMRERLALYDGSLQVADAPEGGVLVHATLPVQTALIDRSAT